MNALDGSLIEDTAKNPDGLDELLDGAASTCSRTR